MSGKLRLLTVIFFLSVIGQSCVTQMYRTIELPELNGTYLSSFPEWNEYGKVTYDTVAINKIKPEYINKMQSAGFDTNHVESLIVYNMIGSVRKITLFCKRTEGDAIVILALVQNKPKRELID